MSDVKPRALAARRPLLAELIGTGLLVTVVVGPVLPQPECRRPTVVLQLLENSTATVFGLAVLILVFGPVSGGHLNPVISAVDWLLSRRPGNGFSAAGVAMYAAAQLIGAVLGAMLANIMFDLPTLQISGKDRISLGHGLGEVVATAGLVVVVVFALAQTRRAALSAAAVGAYIGAAYWFTSSTSFANPAVTVGRILSDTFAGIAPASAVLFIAAQVLGGLVGLGLVRFFFPDARATADRVVVPHPNHVPEEG
jgi:glycerol uptake facilitator-like aquaporin